MDDDVECALHGHGGDASPSFIHLLVACRGPERVTPPPSTLLARSHHHHAAMYMHQSA